MGAGRRRLIKRHLIPNTLGTLIVNATFQVADAIILLATLSTLIPYTFCSLAGLILHRRDGRLTWSSGATIVSSLAFLYSMFALAGAGAETVFAGFLLLMAGLPIYAFMSSSR